MKVIRHPKLASDIRDVANHYEEASERILASFWTELDLILASIERNPCSHHLMLAGFVERIFRDSPIICSMESLEMPFSWWFSGMIKGIRVSDSIVGWNNLAINACSRM